jgi:hypothetical protein
VLRRSAAVGEEGIELRGHGWIWRTFAPLLAALVAASAASAAAAAPAAKSHTRSTDPGLWLVAENGRIQALGGADSLATRDDDGWAHRSTIVAAAATPTGAGLWVASEDGRVFGYGNASSYGPSFGRRGPSRAAAIVGTPSGRGYLLAFDDGQVQAYGDADSHGSATVPRGDEHGIVGMALTPSGDGYWLAGADGAVYAFGDAARLGSAARGHDDARIVAVAVTPTGRGLWLADADGRVVALGDAPAFPDALHRHGDPGHLAGIAPTPSGRGLWLADTDGSLETLGDATGLISPSHDRGPGRIVAVASSTPTGSLTVTVTSLPGTASAAVAVTGAGASFDVLATETLRVAAGDYDVTAAMIHSGNTTYAPTVGGSPVTVAPGAAGFATVDYFNAVPDTTRVVTAAAVETATGDAATGVTLTLAAASAPALAVGNIVALGVTPATPNGLLGRVTSLSAAGGLLTVQTAPATLFDAVARGDIDLEANLADTGGGSAPGQAVPPKTARRTQARRASQALPNLLQQIDKNIDCGAEGSVSLTGSITMTPHLTVKAKWGGFLHPTHVDSAEFSLSMTESATLALAAKAAAHCSLSETPLLPKPITDTFTIMVGPVPVVIVAELQLELSASGSIEASVETSVTQTLTAKAGVAYDHGSFSPIAEIHPAFSFVPPAPVTSMSAWAKLGPKLTLLIDDVAGPELNVYGGLDFEANLATALPAPWWTLAATIEAGVGFTVPIINEDWSKPDLLAYRRVLKEGFVRPVDVTVTPSTASAGDSVVVSGGGFAAKETVVLALGGGGGGSLGTATADSTGSFSVSVGLPVKATVGNHSISATGRTSGSTGSVVIAVVPPPPASVSVDPVAALAGDTVNISGSGFVAKEAVLLDLGGGGGGSLGRATADATGSFSASVSLPAKATVGNHSISATGRASGRAGSAFIAIVPVTVTVDPDKAAPGDTVTVSSRGFRARETITLVFELGGPSLGTVRADSAGAFSTSVTLPADASDGFHSIVATGRASGTRGVGNVTVVTPPAEVSVDPGSAKPGDTVTVNGSSFRARETVDLVFELDGPSLGVAVADSSGAFSTTVVVPADATDGDHAIVATGRASTKTGSATVYVSKTGSGPPAAASFHLTVSTHQGLITEAPCGTSCVVTLFADYGDGFVPVSGTLTLGATKQVVPVDACPAYDSTAFYASTCTYDVVDAHAFRLVSTEPVDWNAGKDVPNICTEPQLGTVCTVSDITAATYKFKAYTPNGYWGYPPNNTSPPLLLGTVWTDQCGADCTLSAPRWATTVGSTLTVDYGGWTGAPTLEAQWFHCSGGFVCEEVATGPSYTVSSADCPGDPTVFPQCGYEIYAQVVATNTHGGGLAVAQIDPAADPLTPRGNYAAEVIRP